MKKFITLVSITLSIAFAIALANAEDISTSKDKVVELSSNSAE